MTTKATNRTGTATGDKRPEVSGKPGGNLQGGSGGSQNKPKKAKSGGGKS